MKLKNKIRSNASERIGFGKSIKLLYNKYGILFILILEIIIFACANKTFFTVNNFLSVGRQISFIGIAAIGMTIVMLTGGIDISVGSMLAFSGVVSTKMVVDYGLPIYIGILIAVLLGLVFGFINGISAAKLKIPPLIATLAMMTLLKGITYLITGAHPITNIPPDFKILGQGFIAGAIPVPLIIYIVLFVIGWWFLNRTYIGRRIYAVGGNEEAARLSGINTKRIIIGAYAACLGFTAIAGVLMAGRLGSGQPGIGGDFPMDVLTATVLGGISVNGGKGIFINVFFGAFIMGILTNGMVIIGLSDYWQWVAKGLVLLFAVAMSNLNSEK